MEINMQKLIDAYRANPTDMNALKLAHHAKKHPAATAHLPMVEAVMIEKAREQLAPHVEKLNAIVIGEFI
jgi:hypothetical protein